jgi:hypothetical protein
MTNTINELGQPVGFSVKNFVGPTRPNFDRLAGNSVRVEPISMDDLFLKTCLNIFTFVSLSD